MDQDGHRGLKGPPPPDSRHSSSPGDAVGQTPTPLERDRGTPIATAQGHQDALQG